MSAFTDWIHRAHLRLHERPAGTFGPDDRGVKAGCTDVCDWLEDPEAALPEARRRAAVGHEKFAHPGSPEECEAPHDVLCKAVWP